MRFRPLEHFQSENALKRGTAPSDNAVRPEAEVLAAHDRTRGTYGAERLYKELVAGGCAVSLWKVKRIRHECGIVHKRKRRIVRTTDSNHTLPVAPNLLISDVAGISTAIVPSMA